MGTDKDTTTGGGESPTIESVSPAIASITTPIENASAAIASVTTPIEDAAAAIAHASLRAASQDEADAAIIPTRYRTIWISDLHLGTKGSKADFILDFLRATESETLYLVGDIFDGWELSRAWHWPQSHNDVVQKLLRKARKHTVVFYLPGNHDEFARQYLGLMLGDILVVDDIIHTTADGRRLLVIHGDQFDGIVRYSKWLAMLGSAAYQFSIELNNYYNAIRRALGYPYWSLSAYLKNRVKSASKFIEQFENALAHQCRLRKCDGVVCGHIHKAEMRRMTDVDYYNDGDWVESCTALVEHFDGRMEILRWTDLGALKERVTSNQ